MKIGSQRRAKKYIKVGISICVLFLVSFSYGMRVSADDDYMNIDDMKYAGYMPNLIRWFKTAPTIYDGHISGVTGLWKSGLDESKPKEKKLLGNQVGEQATFTLDNTNNYNEFPYAWKWSEPNGYSYISRGAEYAYNSPEMSNDITAINEKGDIKVQIISRQSPDYMSKIIFTRLRDNVDNSDLDLMFDLVGLKSQVNVWAGNGTVNTIGIYTFSGKYYGESNLMYDFKDYLKKDQTNIKTKDSVLYVGQTWDKESNFVGATDEDGNAIPWSDSRISSNGASVDTSKPGTYNLTYTVKGKLKNVDSKFTVTVKEDKSSIQTKNTTLKVGQTWDKKSNFVGATDEDGNAIPWSDSRISTNGASVDTSKPGVTKLRYTYKGKVKNTGSDFTVTVEDPLKLIVPSNSDFGTYKLGSSNTVLFWNKASKVEVEGTTHSQWDLSVALNSKSSLKDYIKIGEIPITEASQKVLSGTGPMSVTDEVSPGKFIKVDYTGVKQLRKDTGTLQWTLTPSTKGVSE